MLVAVSAVENAERLAVAVAGRKLYAFTVEKVLEYTRDTDPGVILLSWFLGGSGVRAIELIPALRRISSTSEVIVLMYEATEAQRAEAVRFGAFGTTDLALQGWEQRIEQIIAAAGRQRRRRRWGAPAVAVLDVLH